MDYQINAEILLAKLNKRRIFAESWSD